MAQSCEIGMIKQTVRFQQVNLFQTLIEGSSRVYREIETWKKSDYIERSWERIGGNVKPINPFILFWGLLKYVCCDWDEGFEKWDSPFIDSPPSSPLPFPLLEKCRGNRYVFSSLAWSESVHWPQNSIINGYGKFYASFNFNLLSVQLIKKLTK